MLLEKNKKHTFIIGLSVLATLLVFSFSVPEQVRAQQDGRGACSWHGGVDCSEGEDWDGSVICNDGWEDSSVDYDLVCEEEKSDALIFSTHSIYESVLNFYNNQISELETKTTTSFNSNFNNWFWTIRPQHEDCLLDNTPAYCNTYAIKNNYISSAKMIMEYFLFRHEVHELLVKKSKIAYVGIENGQVVSEGPLLSNLSFVQDYQENNVVRNKNSSLATQFGDYLRNTFQNFNAEAYKELTDQLLNDQELRIDSKHYIYYKENKSYDKAISFNGSLLTPQPRETESGYAAPPQTYTPPSQPISLAWPDTESPVRQSFRIDTKDFAPTETINADREIEDYSPSEYCAANSLVKGSRDAVYYCGNNGKRYVFPSSQTYFTWYTNFDNVAEVTDDILAKIPIGGNVTHRPGMRMVKIQSDPKVYAIGVGGVLRPIASEEVARELYGDNWNQLIDDISVAFFTNYRIGEEINF